MSTSLTCPKCGASSMTALETRRSPRLGGSVRRRRRCNECGEVHVTLEAFEPAINEIAPPEPAKGGRPRKVA